MLLRTLAVTLIVVILTASSTKISIDAPSSYCAGSVSQAWLDVVFLVDSSAAMTQNGVRNAEAFVKSAMRQLSIGADAYQRSRVGIVTYAAEATIVRDLSRADNSSSVLPYAGDKDSNLLGAIGAAVDMFDNYTSIAHHQRVIVIAASTYKQGGPNDPAQAAAQFAIGGGAIVTIDYRQQSSGVSPLSSLATNGFAFTNDDQEVANLFNALLHVNCFCSENLQTVTTSVYGSPESGCLGAEMFQSDWVDAAEMCEEAAGALVKVDSIDKQKAIDRLTKKAYWIGLKYDAPRRAFFWQDWTEADFTRWGPSQPDLGAGECVYSSGSLWYSSACDGDEVGAADRIYYCESSPCAADADCFHPVARVFTRPPLPAETTTTVEQSTAAEEKSTTTAEESTTAGTTTVEPSTVSTPTTEAPFTGTTNTEGTSTTSFY